MIFLVLPFLLGIVNSLTTTAPIWVTSNFFRAGNQNVISTLTGSSANPAPTYTFTFSSPVSNIPQLGYGVKNYEGNDYFSEEMFEIQRIALTTSTFTVEVEILGWTNIWILNVPYIAVDPSFPHHLNSFDNVPVNYSDGNIQNISVASMSLQSYTNTINYTEQTGNRTFKYFSTPLGNSKILLFITTLFIKGVNDINGPPFYPIDYNVQTNIVSTTHYSITVTLSINIYIDRLHFSQIIFDQEDVETSRKYVLVYEHYDLNGTGGFIQVPEEFVDNFILGFVDFSTQLTKSSLYFNWDFKNVSGVHGVNIQASIPRSNLYPYGLIRQGITLFYIKTWYCPTPYTFDNTLNLCVLCEIPGCLDCENLICYECDNSTNYFFNATNDCELCSIPNCLACSNLNECQACDSGYFLNSNDSLCYACSASNCQVCSSISQCRTCDAGYFLNSTDSLCYACSVSNCLVCSSLTACQTCDTSSGYFVNSTDSLCHTCSISNCLTCSTLYHCASCDNSAGYFVNSTDSLCHTCSMSFCLTCITLYQCGVCDSNQSYYVLQTSPGIAPCAFCDPDLNNFINFTTLDCEPCTLNQCVNCTDFYTCTECNQANGYFLNFTDSLCDPCSIPNCITCETLYQCKECNETAQYFVNSPDGQCIPCSLEGCVNCSSLQSCYECNTSADYGFSMLNLNICGGCNESCTCKGYYMPWDSMNESCSSECGDGMIVLQEECDDNNNVSGEGCSMSCQIEDFYSCVGQPSNCSLLGFITFDSIQKTGCNTFSLHLDLTPPIPASQSSIVLDLIYIPHPNITIMDKKYSNGVITIDAEYKGDISGGLFQVAYSSIEFDVSYDQMVKPMHYSAEECELAETIEKILEIVEYMSYGILLISLILSCKIIGLELFGILQLAYFDLAHHDFFSIALSPLAKFRSFNGINLQVFDETAALPSNISSLQISSCFLNNFNIMYLLLAAELVLAVFITIGSCLFNSKGMKTVGMRLLKEGFLTLILFNCFNIAFSSGIHWKYAQTSDQFYVLSSVGLYVSLCCMVAVVFLLQATASKDYGEFKLKFKKNFVCRMYIALTLLFRISLGLYISLQNDYEFGAFIIIAFSLSFSMYNIINLPFNNVFHNYRTSIIHLTQFIILMVTNYYRSMKSTTPLEVKTHYHTAAKVEIGMILVCVLVSLLVLVYDLVKFCKSVRDYCSNKKQQIIDDSEAKIIKVENITTMQFDTE